MNRILCCSVVLCSALGLAAGVLAFRGVVAFEDKLLLQTVEDSGLEKTLAQLTKQLEGVERGLAERDLQAARSDLAGKVREANASQEPPSASSASDVGERLQQLIARVDHLEREILALRFGSENPEAVAATGGAYGKRLVTEAIPSSRTTSEATSSALAIVPPGNDSSRRCRTAAGSPSASSESGCNRNINDRRRCWSAPRDSATCASDSAVSGSAVVRAADAIRSWAA